MQDEARGATRHSMLRVAYATDRVGHGTRALRDRRFGRWMDVIPGDAPLHRVRQWSGSLGAHLRFLRIGSRGYGAHGGVCVIVVCVRASVCVSDRVQHAAPSRRRIQRKHRKNTTTLVPRLQ